MNFQVSLRSVSSNAYKYLAIPHQQRSSELFSTSFKPPSELELTMPQLHYSGTLPSIKDK